MTKPPGALPPTASYAVVHLVSQESQADLIGPQVIDPLRVQMQRNGAGGPARVIAVFLEAARVARRKDVRARVRSFRKRAPEVQVMLHPFISRLGIARNAWLLAKRLRWATRDYHVVFHCRGENAVEWAVALRRHMPGAAIVADIRGAWPEEFLFARGFDGPEVADHESREAYRLLTQRLRTALTQSARVISVSPGMLTWLSDQGAAREQLTYVPCCVRDLTFDARARKQVRAQLGVDDRLVLAYMGTLAPYQHIGDGVIPFVHAMMQAHDDVHFLALVNDVDRMRRLLSAQGVPATRATVMTVPQGEVARYLSGADAGLLLRAPSRMNRFSQPTKLGEYLAAGLPVVVSRGTGQVDQLVEANDAGFAVDVFGVPIERLAAEAARVWQGLRARGGILRNNALELCDREFRWSAYTDRVRETYRTALMSGSS